MQLYMKRKWLYFDYVECETNVSYLVLNNVNEIKFAIS